MNLQPKQAFVVEGEAEILASYEAIREVVNGITIDSSKVVAVDGKKVIQKGMPMSKIANGKYVPYNKDGTDGSEKPTVILKRSVDVSDGDHVVGGFEMANVISDRLPVEVTSELIAAMPFIQFA